MGSAPGYASGKSGIGGMTLHEQQHAVQGIEGFGQGGNQDFNLPIGAVKQEARNAYEINRNRAPDADDELLAELGISRPNTEKPWDDLTPREQLGWYDAGRGRVYRNLAGEVEARNVQTRMNMSPEERRATPPWETQDVPDDQQIIRGLPHTSELFSDTGKPSLMGSAIAAETANQKDFRDELIAIMQKHGLNGQPNPVQTENYLVTH